MSPMPRLRGHLLPMGDTRLLSRQGCAPSHMPGLTIATQDQAGKLLQGFYSSRGRKWTRGAEVMAKKGTCQI